MFSITLSLFSVIFYFFFTLYLYQCSNEILCEVFDYIHVCIQFHTLIFPVFTGYVVGENDGMVLGRRYFQCPLYHGVFVRANNVRFIPLIRW